MEKQKKNDVNWPIEGYKRNAKLTLCTPNFISISLPAAANVFMCFIWNLL